MFKIYVSGRSVCGNRCYPYALLILSMSLIVALIGLQPISIPTAGAATNCATQTEIPQAECDTGRTLQYDRRPELG